MVLEILCEEIRVGLITEELIKKEQWNVDFRNHSDCIL